MQYSLSGGAGFLGLHLSRRLLADGHQVRTLDVVPLDDAELERSVEELRGDVRDADEVRALVTGADVVVHAAAALPIQASRDSIRSVNVGGTENVLRAARDAGVRRVAFISSTAVYGVPEKHPIEEEDPLVGVGSYGESKIDAEGLCRVAAVETTIIRPKTFVGPERLGVFEILFDWIREGRRIYILGQGHNRYQLLAVEDLVDAIVRAAEAPEAAGKTFNVGSDPVSVGTGDLRVALQDGAQGLLRRRLKGAAAPRLAAAAVEQRDADRDLRLVSGQSRAGRPGRRNAPGSLEPAGSRPAQTSLLIVLTQADVRELLDLDALVDALASAHVELSAGKASMPPRIAALANHEGLLGAMPSYLPSTGLAAADAASARVNESVRKAASRTASPAGLT